ncbi:class I SAM-dependent methyltransferase [Oceanibaculum indicum]|nr:class I SAM-dependent methyltransferase [Oceanibaculum indicum]
MTMAGCKMKRNASESGMPGTAEETSLPYGSQAEQAMEKTDEMNDAAAIQNASDGEIAAIARAYERYFASGFYDQRYPRHNAQSLATILQVGREARAILDFGCGDGRYVLPLLHTTGARIFAYDICPVALKSLERRIANEPARDRVQTILGPREDYTEGAPVDLALIMFGVLGHIPGRANRVATLRRIRDLLTQQGSGNLVVSVPNAARRFRLEQQEHKAALAAGQPRPPAREDGDILYSRAHDGERIELFYHLYSPAMLAGELRDAGFRNVRMQAESVWPESGVTRSATLATFDRLLRSVTPPGLGYGILATAEA